MITDHIGITILVLSIILGIHIVCVNYIQLQQKPHIILGLQVLASIAQVLNQIAFTASYILPISTFFHSQYDCLYVWYFASCTYSTFQILSLVVLIYRSSCILEEYYKKPYICFLTVMLFAAVGFIEWSSFKGSTFSADNYCISTVDVETNLIGKIILFLIYLIICSIFLVVVKCKYDMKSLARTAFIFGSLRVVMAVVALMISISLSFAHVWGSRIFIQFTLENYFGIVASTFVCSVPEKKLMTANSESTKGNDLFSNDLDESPL
ncbi:hypothetical protein HDV06_005222 [Boothiomyces sp. JEL0866]|nr:hypothetical protein HDV06_005222 [Boothiomyces sp. JEL0866]